MSERTYFIGLGASTHQRIGPSAEHIGELRHLHDGYFPSGTHIIARGHFGTDPAGVMIKSKA